LKFVLRIQAGTKVKYHGRWDSAGELARKGQTLCWPSVRVTTEGPAKQRVNLGTVWDPDEEETWLRITNYPDAKPVRQIYARRFWREERFSDQQSRGLNVESTRIPDPERLERLLPCGHPRSALDYGSRGMGYFLHSMATS